MSPSQLDSQIPYEIQPDNYDPHCSNFSVGAAGSRREPVVALSATTTRYRDSNCP